MSRWLILGLLLTGVTVSAQSNVYRAEAKLPAQLRRVAVLPLPAGSGRELLESVLSRELAQRRLVEVVPVSAEWLRQATGRAEWLATDELPVDFFQRIRAGTGCDAVLFVRVTEFQPYPPLQVGWNVRLVECESARTVWAVDEVFAAGDPAVAAAARRYHAARLRTVPALASSDGMLLSPRWFGQFAAHAVVGTMPGR